MSDFKNYVTEIISKSPSRRLVRLQGKLKPTEKENNLRICKFFLYFSLFHCASRQPISVTGLG
jgi:hypothetical protein